MSSDSIGRSGQPGTGRDVLWQRLGEVGLEHCRLQATEDGPLISGVVVMMADGEPATIDYVVRCNHLWHTREVIVSIARAIPAPSLHLVSDGEGNWWRRAETEKGHEDTPVPQVADCIDIDLSFTPSTNTLPIRRHELEVASTVKTTAAWVKFPSLEVATLPQQYERLSATRYRYESFPHNFVAMLEVDDLGLVRSYEGLWERVGQAEVAPE